jgi:hypothetical protein
MNLWNEKWFGFWKTDEDSLDEDSLDEDSLDGMLLIKYPDIKKYIDQGRETDVRFLEYLKNGIVLAVTTKSNCLAEVNCTSYFDGGLTITIKTDGNFIWSSDLVHYIVNHGVCIPEFWKYEILSRDFKYPEKYKEIMRLLQIEKFNVFNFYEELGLVKYK